MKIYRVVLEETVPTEIENAFLWIARDAPSAAQRWYVGCIEAIESLTNFPERCALAPEDAYFDEEIRELLYGAYRILFTIAGDNVHVLHIRHEARKPFDPRQRHKDV